VRFSLDVAPHASLSQALLMTESQVEWLEANWRLLIRDRENRGLLDPEHPSIDVLADALFLDTSRTHPPFSVDRPPAKWGYYVGLQWASETMGPWHARLTSGARRPRRGG